VPLLFGVPLRDLTGKHGLTGPSLLILQGQAVSAAQLNLVVAACCQMGDLK
jgi:hypothetical protein